MNYSIVFFLMLISSAAFGQGLGVNLSGVTDYSAPLFCDAAKQARCFGSPEKSYDCKFGDKIPAEPFGMFVYTDWPNLNGTYAVSYLGKSDLASSGKVENLKYDLATNLTTANVTMGSQAMTLKFSNIASAISNIKIQRPNCVGTFNPEYLDSVKFYSALRFMDWLRTNANPIKTWADRRLPSELQTGIGVALEYVAEFANATGKDVWVNVPVQADEDYIRNMAKLLKEKLKPSLKILVEHSNEIWNTAGGETGPFRQSFQLLAMAKAAVASGQTDLQDGPTDMNEWYWQRRLHAKRTALISKIYREVFGDAAMGSRVQIVLAGHAADHSKARAGLQFLEKSYGRASVSKIIQQLAIAPYYATGNHLLKVKDPITGKETTTLKPEATIQTVLDGCQDSINSNSAQWVSRKPWDGKSQDVNHREYADYYGIKLAFYESGHHLNNTVGAALVKSAKLDPKFQATNKDYFMKFFNSNPGGSAFQFAGIGTWKTGNEFASHWDFKIETPQTLALKEVAAQVNKDEPPPEPDPDEIEIALLKKKVADLEAQLVEKTSKVELCGSELLKSQNENRACTDEKSKLQLKLDLSKDGLTKILEGMR